MHEVINIAHLEPYHKSPPEWGSRPTRSTLRSDFDDAANEEWEVEDIVDQEFRKDYKGRSQPWYRIRYKGYGPEDDVWLPLKELKHLPEIKQRWLRQNPTRPSSAHPTIVEHHTPQGQKKSTHQSESPSGDIAQITNRRYSKRTPKPTEKFADVPPLMPASALQSALGYIFAGSYDLPDLNPPKTINLTNFLILSPAHTLPSILEHSTGENGEALFSLPLDFASAMKWQIILVKRGIIARINPRKHVIDPANPIIPKACLDAVEMK
ncbi:hypothetical protein SISSUDRAFT_1038687, partial [Sistotremastrum suecicum HHB10207 ss-3]